MASLYEGQLTKGGVRVAGADPMRARARFHYCAVTCIRNNGGGGGVSHTRRWWLSCYLADGSLAFDLGLFTGAHLLDIDHLHRSLHTTFLVAAAVHRTECTAAFARMCVHV